MTIDVESIERSVSDSTGLEFESEGGGGGDGEQWCVIRPKGLPPSNTFSIRMVVGWRRLRIAFVPGEFAGQLLLNMGGAMPTARIGFAYILRKCCDQGANVDLRFDGSMYSCDDDSIWRQDWTRVDIGMSVGPIALGLSGGHMRMHDVCSWMRRFTTAIVILLPLEERVIETDPSVRGFPEGGVVSVRMNRYERDSRNRAAALIMHGASCKGCGLDMTTRYGEIAMNLIEIHHVTPISELGDGYCVDPVHDLIPLCPNCHAVVHRSDPPLSVEELRDRIF